jgi:hypothetical protein
LGTVDVDQPDLTSSDPFVDPGLVRGRRCYGRSLLKGTSFRWGVRPLHGPREIRGRKTQRAGVGEPTPASRPRRRGEADSHRSTGRTELRTRPEPVGAEWHGGDCPGAPHFPLNCRGLGYSSPTTRGQFSHELVDARR